MNTPKLKFKLLTVCLLLLLGLGLVGNFVPQIMGISLPEGIEK